MERQETIDFVSAVRKAPESWKLPSKAKFRKLLKAKYDSLHGIIDEAINDALGCSIQLDAWSRFQTALTTINFFILTPVLPL